MSVAQRVLGGVPHEGVGRPLPNGKISHHLSYLAFAEKLIGAVQAQVPYAHLRLSDGEAALICGLFRPSFRRWTEHKTTISGARSDDKLVLELCSSYKQADSIGIQALEDGQIFETEFMRIGDTGKNLTIESLRHIGISVEKICAVEVHAVYWLFTQPQLLQRLLRDMKVLLVGDLAGRALERTRASSWRRVMGWTAWSTSAFEVPSHVGDGYPGVLDALNNRLKSEVFDLVLLGAGAAAKPLGAAVKRFGIVAVDIGHVMNGLLGEADPKRPFMAELNRMAK